MTAVLSASARTWEMSSPNNLGESADSSSSIDTSTVGLKESAPDTALSDGFDESLFPDLT
ncbi:hypothetical protein [Saccharomonospora azurea]|uniref:hypothetical protein n=1 Tax=Saccharomonospora azurea TaxID=40988 RepID=UPI001E546FF2|nr:hypothetical protein [Saccharomonospora azurea]